MIIKKSPIIEKDFLSCSSSHAQATLWAEQKKWRVIQLTIGWLLMSIWR